MWLHLGHHLASLGILPGQPTSVGYKDFVATVATHQDNFERYRDSDGHTCLRVRGEVGFIAQQTALMQRQALTRQYGDIRSKRIGYETTLNDYMERVRVAESQMQNTSDSKLIQLFKLSVLGIQDEIDSLKAEIEFLREKEDDLHNQIEHFGVPGLVESTWLLPYGPDFQDEAMLRFGAPSLSFSEENGGGGHAAVPV